MDNEKSGVMRVDFEVLNTPIQQAYAEVLSKVKRLSGHGIPDGLPVVVQLHLQVTYTAYQAIRYLCVDTPTSKERKAEFLSACQPIQRSMLDAVFDIIYLGLDLHDRTRAYYKAGWKESFDYYRKHQQKYGALPEWQGWLEELRLLTEGLAKSEHLTEADHDSIDWWPTPLQMIGDSSLPRDVTDFLSHLRDWFYKSYSQADHLSWPGLAIRGVVFLREPGSQSDQEYISKQKSDQVYRALLLLLMILSEINARFSLGHDVQLQYIWTILLSYFGETKELYELRYQRLLQPSR